MSNGPEFFETQMGRRYYESTMPRIAEALETIAVALEAIAKALPKDVTPKKDE